MKKIITHLLVSLAIPLTVYPQAAGSQYGSGGINRVDIYRNSTLEGTWTEAFTPIIRPDTGKPDTIVFHAWADWDGLRNSTINIQDNTGELVNHINSISNTGYEAVFVYVLDLRTMAGLPIKSLGVFLKLASERDIEPRQIALIPLL